MLERSCQLRFKGAPGIRQLGLHGRDTGLGGLELCLAPTAISEGVLDDETNARIRAFAPLHRRVQTRLKTHPRFESRFRARDRVARNDQFRRAALQGWRSLPSLRFDPRIRQADKFLRLRHCHGILVEEAGKAHPGLFAVCLKAGFLQRDVNDLAPRAIESRAIQHAIRGHSLDLRHNRVHLCSPFPQETQPGLELPDIDPGACRLQRQLIAAHGPFSPCAQGLCRCTINICGAFATIVDEL